MNVALTNCLLVDGRGGAPQPAMTVVIEDATISEVSRRRDFGPEQRVVDLGGRALLPGLIDCHVHFALWAQDLLAHPDEPISYLTAQTYQALRDTLAAGCTSARDCGGLDRGFRDAIDDGVATGPRIQTSVTVVSPINGIVDGYRSGGLPVPVVPGMPRPECTGPVEARAKVREVLRAGADFIKIAASGGVSSRRRQPTSRLFTEEELTAIVDEAHAWGVPVICHAIGGDGPLLAVRAGVDTIEHGVWLTDECISEMAARNTWYVPTFTGYETHREIGTGRAKAWSDQMRDPHVDSFRRAREAGVRIAFGSDTGVYGHDFKQEFGLLVAAGMTPGEAIAAATSVAATCLGWSDRLGTIEAGLAADLIVVDGDPTEDIRVLTDPNALRCVIKAGSPVARPGNYVDIAFSGMSDVSD